LRYLRAPRRPPTSTLFPYTTLFRSATGATAAGAGAGLLAAVAAAGCAGAASAWALEAMPGKGGRIDLRGVDASALAGAPPGRNLDRKSTRLNSSHVKISYAVFCLKK